jgi:hypothetical protein
MGHRLSPLSGVFLAPDEVVRRLHLEFAALDANAEEGREYVRNMLTRVLELKARGIDRGDDYAGRLQRAEPHSVALFIADDASAEYAHLSCCCMPGEPLFFSYTSRQHEEAARPLLERCARVLGYAIALV